MCAEERQVARIRIPRSQEREEPGKTLLEHLPLVHHIARRIHDRLPAHVPLADLVQAGVIGLMDAMKKFDAVRSVHFPSYASFRIRGAILDSLRAMDWGPRELRRRARHLQETRQRLENELGRSPTEPEIASAAGLKLDEFYRQLGELCGLDLGQLQVDRVGVETHEVVAPQEQGPHAQYERAEQKAWLAEAIAQLPEKEQQVLSLYYFEELTMKEVGVVLGVTESRVSQLHSMALVRMRGPLAPAPEAKKRHDRGRGVLRRRRNLGSLEEMVDPRCEASWREVK